MDKDTAPARQPQVTQAAPSSDLDHEEAPPAGPTDAVFSSWKTEKKQKKAPTAAELQGKRKEGSEETHQAVEASLDAIAGRLDHAAERIELIIKTPFGAEGPGESVKLIEKEIDNACHVHAFEVVARHKVTPRSKTLQLLASSEARLGAAIQNATSYAKTHGQQIDTRLFIGVQSALTGLIGPASARAQMNRVGAQPSSTEDLRADAVIEHLEAALARVQFLRMGIDSAKPEELHASIEEYTAHQNSVGRIANDIIADRGRRKSGISKTVKKRKDTALGALVKEVGALLSETKGNPNVKQQTKWSDVAAKLTFAKPLVAKL